MRDEACRIVKELLDQTERGLLQGDFPFHVAGVNVELTKLRRSVPETEWLEKIKPIVAAHPVFLLLRQDPYTQRAWSKPRGYAGDAVMLDYLYFAEPPAGTSGIGVGVFQNAIVSPGGLAVKWRAQLLGQEIDAIAARSQAARVLSLACGHLREAMFSKALSNGGVEALFAVDQDPESLKQAQNDYGHLPVKIQRGAVKEVLKGTVAFDNLHLAYAAGLYDYLPQPVAKQLTTRLFGMLTPGGKVIVTNFLTDNPVRGYMEAVMDWNLVLRTEQDITALAAGLPATQIASQRYHQDPYGVVGYLEVVKA